MAEASTARSAVQTSARPQAPSTPEPSSSEPRSSSSFRCMETLSHAPPGGRQAGFLIGVSLVEGSRFVILSLFWRRISRNISDLIAAGVAFFQEFRFLAKVFRSGKHTQRISGRALVAISLIAVLLSVFSLAQATPSDAMALE